MANKWILSLKVTLISAGVLSTAVIFHLSFPTLLDFLDSEIPHLRSIIAACLKPPYPYILLNCIILTIVASNKLQPPKTEPDPVEAVVLNPPVVVPVPIKAPEELIFEDQSPIEDVVAVGAPAVFGYVEEVAEEVLEATVDEETAVVEATMDEETAVEEVVIGGGEAEDEEFVVPRSAAAVEEVVIGGGEAEDEEFVVPRSADWLPPRYPVSGGNEKPRVSRRFGYRRSGKPNPEGGKAVLGVSKPKRQDTLESTWRMITEGRPIPLTRHLKKSETFDTQARGPRNDDSPSPALLINKSDTLHGHATAIATANPSPGGGGDGPGRLKREPSLSQDELNRRVEAFIRKFNEEMRLQRQESLKQYTEMVGGH